MNSSQRRLVATVLTIFGVGLPWHFIEFRADDANALHDPTGLILGLGEGSRPPPEGNEELPPGHYLPPGSMLITQRGIYARRDYAVGPAAIGGLIVPVLLIGCACYLALGSRKF